MKDNTIILLLLGLVVLVLLVSKLSSPHKKHHENLTFGSPATELAFTKDQQYFEGIPPSLKVENDYHRYIREDCGGDYNNYECRQKAYIKTMKDGTFDKADLICHAHKNDEDAYYSCLDGVYGNYLFMDRFTGVNPCRCGDRVNGQGALGGDATGKIFCHCPPKRDLSDRRPLDQFYRPVERVL